MDKRSRLCGLVLLAWAVLAQAGSISQFSPQGTVNKVRQARATFSEPAVKAGWAAAGRNTCRSSKAMTTPRW